MYDKDGMNVQAAILSRITRLIFLPLICLLIGLSLGCEEKTKSSYVVGIIRPGSALEVTITGFKHGMAGLGYQEGKNVKYIDEASAQDTNGLGKSIERLLDSDVDLIFSLTTSATQVAQRMTRKSGTPVVFAHVTDPVGSGIVSSLKSPGGNITGVTHGIYEHQRLQWLVRVFPHIRQIYVPYNPHDKGALASLEIVQIAAEKLGIKISTYLVNTFEDLNEAMENIPPQADAIYALPDIKLAPLLPRMVEAALKEKKPISVPNTDGLERGAQMCYGVESFSVGEQAARLADQVLRGVNPGDLPVETGKCFLGINLKAITAIGLLVPDSILRQAEILVR